MKVLDCKSSAELEMTTKASISRIGQVTLSKEQVHFKSKSGLSLAEKRDPKEDKESYRLRLGFFNDVAKDCHNFLREHGLFTDRIDEDSKELGQRKSELQDYLRTLGKFESQLNLWSQDYIAKFDDLIADLKRQKVK